MGRDAKKDRANWMSLFKVLRFAKRHWWLIGASLLVIAASSASEVGYLFLIAPFSKVIHGWSINIHNADIDLDQLYFLAKLTLALAPAIALLAFLQDYLSGWLNWRLLVDLRNAVCNALMPQSLKFFEDRRSGDLMSRITNDVHRSQAVFKQVFSDLPKEISFLIFGIGVAAYGNWRLFLMGLVVVPFIVIPLSVLARRIRRYGRRGLETLADLTDLMSQMFTGIRIIKAYKMEDAEAQEFNRVNQRLKRKMMKTVTAHALSAGTIEFIIRFFIAIGVIVGIWLLHRPNATLDLTSFILFIGGSYYAFNALRKVVKAYNHLQEVMPAADRVLEMIEHVPALRDLPDAVALDRVKQRIAFENVTFGYDGELVLRNVSFGVERGETVAVVGRSGAGKSTLMALLPRFYDVTEGAVKIDGTDVRCIRHGSLLDQFAIVSQQTFLFNRTVADNIRYGKRNATIDEVMHAARMANIHDFIMTQEGGYDMLCGEFGGKLSGGQRQRISIARALLKNAEILILDEAMVGLDAESESLVQEALRNLMRGRTTFVITHDLGTIQNADRILVLDGGRLVGQGKHSELMTHCTEYRNLYALQFAGLK